MARRVASALLATLQAAFLMTAALADPPPEPAGHVPHLAGEAAPGCQPLHDEHCVVCRVLTTEAIGAVPVAAVAISAPVDGSLETAPLAPIRAPDPASPLQARAPPIG